MAGRTRKLGTLVAVAATAALALSAMGVHAAPAAVDKDHYVPAGATVKGTNSTNTTFALAGGVLTVTCTHSTAGGKTPATGLGKFAIKPLPQFNDGSPTKPCTDTTGATDKTVTKGAWTIGFIDAANDEASAEPNSGDQLQVTVPKAGAIVTNSAGCKITVGPSAAFTVTGAYDDHSTFTISGANIPVAVTGPIACPTFVTSASFNGTYVFAPGVSDAS